MPFSSLSTTQLGSVRRDRASLEHDAITVCDVSASLFGGGAVASTFMWDGVGGGGAEETFYLGGKHDCFVY